MKWSGVIPAVLPSVFPRPRRPVKVLHAWPLALFLVVMLAGWGVVEAVGYLRFGRPSAFLLLIVTPWVWWMHAAGASGLAGWRATAALLTRLLLIGVLVMLLGEPRAVRKSDKLSVMYALDVSDSIGHGATDAALKFIMGTATGKPEKDEAGMVVFGRSAAVELPPRMNFPFEAINSRIEKDATSLEKGLSLAGAMLPEENPGRIVLISDGTQTEGDLARVLGDLKSRGVAVDVLPIAYDFDREVWLERLELPRTVKIGETYEASVVLTALKPGKGKLVLRENDNVVYEGNVEFNAGKSRFVLPIYLREPGYYEYAATIETPAGEDGWKENNTAISYLFLKGEGKVLLVTDPQGNDKDWETLASALREAKRLVELRPAYEFPRDSLSLMPYDCVIFPNVPADAFDAQQLQALRDAVYNLGVGFLMVGGQNSFGPGGFHRTPVEEALPVSMDITQKKVLPKGALAIILHSCEFPEGNTWGKNITKRAMKVLGARDEVGLLAYGNGGQDWVFDLTPAGEYDRLAPLVENASIGDMPSFDTLMRKAMVSLKKSDAAAKHMIIISDGDPAPPVPELVQEFINEKVSVSFVIINPHGGQDPSSVNAVAKMTGGRYYLVMDASQLPSIFIKEAKTLKRSMIQNKTFVPTVEFPSDILKGIDTIPQLKGYVLTSPKNRSSTILKGPETEEIDPVLSTWRFGVGKTAAFTGDLSPNWGASWVDWKHYQAFVKQLMIDISRVSKDGYLQMRTFAAGDQGVILVDDYAPGDAFLELRAQVAGPRNSVDTIDLKPVGPRRYEAKFPLAGKGRYQVMVAGAGAGAGNAIEATGGETPGVRSEQVTGGFIVPYSPEYMRFRSNPITLDQIWQITGGRLLKGVETGKDIFGLARQPRESSRPVFDLFLLALACLVPLDVAIRRIQIDWALVRGWFTFKRKHESTKTLGALLERKQKVGVAIKSRRDSRPAPLVTAEDLRAAQANPQRPASSSSSRPAAAPPSSPSSQGDAPSKPSSTTESLLAKKRRREKGDI